MNIKEYYRPHSLEEAYGLLQEKKGVVIGGGAFLNLGSREIEAAIDLSELSLNYIEEKDGYIRIGAMTTLREMETSELLKDSFNGILSKTAGVVMGVQVRNVVTIGGCVIGRYGFSDLITALLALDAQVKLYKHGCMSLEEFLENKISGDILTGLIIEKKDKKAAYTNVRNTATDFSILNAAVSRCGSSISICAGARPGIAKKANKASEFVSVSTLNEENAVKAGQIAADELEFGSDLRGSALYRKELCKVLVKRCIMEVL